MVSAAFIFTGCVYYKNDGFKTVALLGNPPFYKVTCFGLFGQGQIML